MIALLVFTATIVLLRFLTGQVNHSLSAWQLQVFSGALAVAFAGFHLPRGLGLAAVILAGLVHDSTVPVATGTHAVLFAAAFLVLHRLRGRIPPEVGPARVLAVLGVNLGLFIVLSLLRFASYPAAGPALGRLLADLLVSQVLVGLAAPWFLSLQLRSFELAGIEPRRLR
jgi:hypothetical protein